MLRVNWTMVDTIHPKDNKFVRGVNIKATVDLMTALALYRLLRLFPSIALRIPTAHNFTRD